MSDHHQGPSPTPQPRGEPLARGAGAGKLLFFDCFSGIAGDMSVAALLDLGVPLTVVEAALAQLPLRGYRLQVAHTQHSGIAATRFDVLVDGEQPERSYAHIEKMLHNAPLDEATKALAQAIFRRLGLAEAQAHRLPLSEVHFHEVGAVDSIVDIVGAAAALAYLGAEVVVSPLPLGRGFVKARHGVLPLPAPATVWCLRGVPTFGVDVEAELVTPTGAAIAASSAQRFSRWPSFSPELVGFGAGHRTLADRPNLLRIVLGKPEEQDCAQLSAASTHSLLEANVDDMTGELTAHAIEALLAAGALDAWATPTVMKKGRPGLTIAALARTEQASDVAQVMLRETTSIGVRQLSVTRTERPRRILQVQTRFGSLPVKLSEGSYGPALAKPEFDACAQAARQHNVPVRVVLEEVLTVFRSAPPDSFGG